MTKTEIPTQPPPQNPRGQQQSPKNAESSPPPTPAKLKSTDIQHATRSKKTPPSVRLPSNKKIPAEIVIKQNTSAPSNEVTLKTQYGDIIIIVEKPLPPNREISIQISETQPNHVTVYIEKRTPEPTREISAVQTVDIKDFPPLYAGDIIQAYFITEKSTPEVNKEFQNIAPVINEIPDIPQDIKEKITIELAQLSEKETQEFVLQITSKIVRDLIKYPDIDLRLQKSPAPPLQTAPVAVTKVVMSATEMAKATAADTPPSSSFIPTDENESNLLAFFQKQIQTKLTPETGNNIFPEAGKLTTTQKFKLPLTSLPSTLIKSLFTVSKETETFRPTNPLFKQISETLIENLQEQRFQVVNIIPENIDPKTIIKTIQGIEQNLSKDGAFQLSSSKGSQVILPQDSKTDSSPTSAPKAEKTPPLIAAPPINLQIGTVSGYSPNGSILLDTDKVQKILITTPVNVPVGSHLILKPLTEPQTITNLNDLTLNTVTSSPLNLGNLTLETQETGFSFPAIPLFSPLQSQEWPALEQAIETLLQTAPSIAQSLKNTIPTPSPRLIPTALFFLVALKMGNIESWLGEKSIMALQNAGRRDIIDRLSGDFSTIARQANEMIAGDWRAISMPLLHDDQVSAFQLLIRDQQKPNDENEDPQNKEKQTRFLLNFKLSKIGPLQLDGLLTGKNLDVIIRVSETLPSEIKKNIREKFKVGLGEVNLIGSLSFKENKSGWIEVTAQKSQTSQIII